MKKDRNNAIARRVFLIVLDSFGIGEAPDAALFGDSTADTLAAVASSKKFSAPTLARLGLFNIDGQKNKAPIGVCIPKDTEIGAAVMRLRELSMGKDTTIGHWEMAGIVSNEPLPTYPDGFPPEIIDAFKEATGRGVLCNKPYSGTDALNDYGEAHLETGDLIVYTSSDSVFQIAAHEDLVPPEKLYEYCRIARRLLTGKHSVGRVIARPFEGEAGSFRRTSRRHDFSLEPQGETMLDRLSASGFDVIGVGKINDIFASKGLTEYSYSESNADGLRQTSELVDRDFCGLCFVNLVDFDSKFGHRRDIDGYAEAISEFDSWLSDFLPKLSDDDVLMITADHGCDPAYTATTDHTREYVPLICVGKAIKNGVYGTADGFTLTADTVCRLLGVSSSYSSYKALPFELETDAVYPRLLKLAIEARENSYSPYSHFKVGAALLSASGRIYQGANIENASYPATVCGERVALFSAVGAGERDFVAVAIVGGSEEVLPECLPCGVCRQTYSEFCDGDFDIITGNESCMKVLKLSELLPYPFDKSSL